MIFGFNFTKISGEKKGAVKGKINISNNVLVKNLEEVDVTFGKSREKALKFTFEFKSVYEPGLGEIVLTGEILDMKEPADMKKIAADWKKSKKLPESTMTNILNTVLSRSNIQALILARDLNLPPSVPLPKVQKKD